MLADNLANGVERFILIRRSIPYELSTTTVDSRMNINQCISLALTTIVVSATVHGQVRPSRTWWHTADWQRMQAGPMASVQGGADVARSSGSTYEEQAWQFRTHVIIEPYRFTDSTADLQITTTISAHQELTANPFNDISFNPRTMRWEEYVQVHLSTASWTMRAGWLHRCKHDIDNIDGPSELNPLSPQSAAQRTIILSGPTISAGLAPFPFLGAVCRVEGGAELFVLASDYRRPAQSQPIGSWKAMQGAVWGRGAAAWSLTDRLRLQTMYYLSAPWFSDRIGAPQDWPLPHEARAEVSLEVNGTAASMALVLHAEHTFDELAFLDARPSTYVGIGLRFGPRW